MEKLLPYPAADRKEYRTRSVAVILVCLFVLFCAVQLPAADKDGFQVRKQPELQQLKPKKPVKIKLKRTAKDEYSWELSGDDAEDIIQTDRRLRKVLGTK